MRYKALFTSLVLLISVIQGACSETFSKIISSEFSKLYKGQDLAVETNLNSLSETPLHSPLPFDPSESTDYSQKMEILIRDILLNRTKCSSHMVEMDKMKFNLEELVGTTLTDDSGQSCPQIYNISGGILILNFNNTELANMTYRIINISDDTNINELIHIEKENEEKKHNLLSYLTEEDEQILSTKVLQNFNSKGDPQKNFALPPPNEIHKEPESESKSSPSQDKVAFRGTKRLRKKVRRTHFYIDRHPVHTNQVYHYRSAGTPCRCHSKSTG
ncbi:hypothetical protein HWI79_1229 [Cryptosporidium felis]|nr:hypothetical protein HWI79_1229 [Cryptosporidium felis]